MDSLVTAKTRWVVYPNGDARVIPYTMDPMEDTHYLAFNWYVSPHKDDIVGMRLSPDIEETSTVTFEGEVYAIATPADSHPRMTRLRADFSDISYSHPYQFYQDMADEYTCLIVEPNATQEEDWEWTECPQANDAINGGTLSKQIFADPSNPIYYSAQIVDWAWYSDPSPEGGGLSEPCEAPTTQPINQDHKFSFYVHWMWEDTTEAGRYEAAGEIAEMLALPVVEAGDDQIVNEGDTVTFSGNFTPISSPETYTINWDFGDGEAASGTLIPSHEYADNGTYTVTLTVTDDDGGVGSDTLVVTVNNVAPAVGIDTVEQPNPDFILPEIHTLTFTGSFSDPGWLDIHTVTWEFGDGTVVDGILTEENEQPDSTGTLTAEFAYAEPGEYVVTLTIIDDEGDFGTDTWVVTVMTNEEAITVVDDTIQDLPDDAFTNNPDQKKNTFSNKLDAVIKQIDEGEYQEAIDKLRDDIRAKADGSLGGDPSDDWITDPEEQEEICAMIDDLIAYLETLL